MRALLLGLLVAFACPAAAQAQADALGAPARGVIVLVLDAGRARVSSDALTGTVTRVLARDVVRITDARARDAVGTLTIAHDAGTRWQVRFEARGRASTLHVDGVRGSAIVELLAGASSRAVAEIESVPEPSSRPAPARSGAPMYLAWTDEILDPFVDAPRPPRREMAIWNDVIDPFAPAASRRGSFTEVLDPWGP